MSESHMQGRALKERSITDPTAARWQLKVINGKGDEWQPQARVWSPPWEVSRLSSAKPILKATSCCIPAKMSTFSGSIPINQCHVPINPISLGRGEILLHNTEVLRSPSQPEGRRPKSQCDI